MPINENLLREEVASTEEFRFLHEWDRDHDPQLLDVYADWLKEHSDPRTEFLRCYAEYARDDSRIEVLNALGETRPRSYPLWLLALGDTERRFRPISAREDSRLVKEFPDFRDRIGYLSQTTYQGTPLLQLRGADSSVSIHHSEGLLDLELYIERISTECLRFFGKEEIAATFRSLYLYNVREPNELSHVNLTHLVAHASTFCRVKVLTARFGNSYGLITFEDPTLDRAGRGREVWTACLEKCPSLEQIALPAAPGESFFSSGIRPLKTLQVETDIEHGDFVHNLSRSTCFPRLQILRYADFGGIDSRYRPTPFEAFAELLRSPAMKKVKTIELTNLSLTQPQLAELLAIRNEGVTLHQASGYQ